MEKPKRLTMTDRLLRAAYSLDKQGKTSFTAEELVVSAWSMFPDAFGLKGFLDDEGVPIYPDSNRVFAEIMGSKPLRKRGLLSKTGPKQYGLTASGREQASILEDQASEQTPQSLPQETRSSLPRDYDRLLARMLSSRASRKVRNGDLESLTFFDACMFWGITPQSSAINMSEKLENSWRVVSEAIAIVGNGSMRIRTSTVTGEDMRLLAEVAETLKRVFQKDLDSIGERTDERGWRH